MIFRAEAVRSNSRKCVKLHLFFYTHNYTVHYLAVVLYLFYTFFIKIPVLNLFDSISGTAFHTVYFFITVKKPVGYFKFLSVIADQK